MGNSYGGFGVLSLLTLLFVSLKSTGATLSWLWVLAPFLVGLIEFLMIAILIRAYKY